jgi:pimeloyl-ACP methyl ester carboxylesterase
MSAIRVSYLITTIALAIAVWSVYQLERAQSAVEIEQVLLGETPATFYKVDRTKDSLVVVSHGFGGSRQMMQAISLTLARAGHTVVAFDYIGHGRHPKPLSPAVETLTGTTEDLVLQTLDVVEKARAHTGLTRVSFVGHSMATDVIVRTAQRVRSSGAVVAISMYSDAVTPTHPKRLLVVSGAFESRLRDVALEAVAQIGPAQEGETVVSGDMTRRAVSAPWVGHVGVLWSSLTLTEIAVWLGGRPAPAATGTWIAALLFTILILFRPLASLLPTADARYRPGTGRAALAASIAAIAAGAAASTGWPLVGLAGFGALGLAFSLWGVLVLLILRITPRLAGPDLVAGLLLVVWGLGVFALALDRYGAAFLPTGPRASLALLLIPPTVIFALADRVLVDGRGMFARIGLRLPFLAALFLAMIVSPTEVGLVFTVLPVMVLYWLVYGTMATWAARRSGPVGAGIGAGIILAWAIAASTPLFQG